MQHRFSTILHQSEDRSRRSSKISSLPHSLPPLPTSPPLLSDRSLPQLWAATAKVAYASLEGPAHSCSFEPDFACAAATDNESSPISLPWDGDDGAL